MVVRGLRSVLGVDAIVMPWRVVYICPDVKHDLLLKLHEMVHIVQIERAGAVRFSWRYLWGLATTGYWQMPYEIEARVRALGTSRWLIAEGKTHASEDELLDAVRRYMQFMDAEKPECAIT